MGLGLWICSHSVSNNVEIVGLPVVMRENVKEVRT